jgi:hypothetical protein
MAVAESFNVYSALTSSPWTMESFGADERKAKVAVVDQVFDAASGTIGVRLELPNPDLRLPAGIHCRVHFGGLS